MIYFLKPGKNKKAYIFSESSSLTEAEAEAKMVDGLWWEYEGNLRKMRIEKRVYLDFHFKILTLNVMVCM